MPLRTPKLAAAYAAYETHDYEDSFMRTPILSSVLLSSVLAHRLRFVVGSTKYSAALPSTWR